MPSEMYLLKQMMSGVAPSYIQFTMLAGLLVAAIFRPERIRRLGMFRTACILLAVSVGLGPTLSVLVSVAASSAGNMHTLTGEYGILFSLVEAVGGILLAVSICLGIFALLPSAKDTYPALPARHPLDS